jgi:glycosyltransferase involved in cell wall biosynthesis
LAFVHVNLPDYSAALINALAERLDVVVLHPSRLTAAMEARLDPDVPTIPFDKPRYRSPDNARAVALLRRRIRQLRPRGIHLQQTDDPWVDASFLLPSRPWLVTTIHDIDPHPGDRDQVPGAAALRRRLMRRADGVIVHTERQRSQAVERGADPGSLAVLPHGELGSLFRGLASRSAGPAAQRVLFFGRIWHYKGLDTLVEAMERVVRDVPGAELVVAGRGEPIERYFPQGVPPWCTVFEGGVDDGEVAPLVEEASLVVLPYREASQSGVAALALGLGKPVVATTVGGLPELVRDGLDGRLVPPERPDLLADAIIDVLGDAALTERMGGHAAERARGELSWGSVADRTIEFYEAIESRSGKRRT